MAASSLVDRGQAQLEVTVFDSFLFLGVALLALVVATAHLSSKVHRSGLWFRHMIAWIIYSITFLLLVGHQLDPNPPFGVCVVQAAFVYAAPTLYVGIKTILLEKHS
jgi:hypothetical protein